MQIEFHNRQPTLIALAAGGLIALGKDLVGVVSLLYMYAQTPKGMAALVVTSLLVSAASLVITVFRRL